MRLICDANIGSRLADALIEAGHDVVRSVHVLSHDAKDINILSHAVADDRILITCDSDFGELIFLKGQKAPKALIYIRYEPDEVAKIIPRLLIVLTSDTILGHIVVVGVATDRMSRLPQ